MHMAGPSELTRCDVLVAGAGVTGLVAALQAAEAGASVLLVSGTEPAGGSSERAQGGIAAATDDDDAPDLHAEDTFRAGRGLCSTEAVRVLVRDGPAWIQKLAALGVPFGRDPGLEGGHSRRRIHHVGGAATGHAMVEVLTRLVRAEPRVTLAVGEHLVALWVADGRCVGARTDRRLIAARATILATGGYAALFARSTNPPGSRGDGALLAYAAGAELADLEFVQFHPTVLEGGALLLSEALRGEGALLLDEHGERFTDELAPRDEVARAVFARGRAFLDLRPIARSRFAVLIDALAALGHDAARAPVPVSPAAHYTMGGIKTDLHGATNIAGLYAAGECACTGVHGANRLASNSLLECVVFGGRAGFVAPWEPALPTSPPPAPQGSALAEPRAAVREALWRHGGVIRDAAGLARLLAAPHPLARLLAEAALFRRESRGSHHRADFPTESAEYAAHTVQRMDAAPRLERWP